MRAAAREGVAERELTVSCGLRVQHTERRRRRPVSECAVTLGAPPKIAAPLKPPYILPLPPSRLYPPCFFVQVSALSSRGARSLARRLTCRSSCSLALMCESYGLLPFPTILSRFLHRYPLLLAPPHPRIQTELVCARSLSLSFPLFPFSPPTFVPYRSNQRSRTANYPFLAFYFRKNHRYETCILHALLPPSFSFSHSPSFSLSIRFSWYNIN